MVSENNERAHPAHGFRSDAEYLAHIISQGRTIGASWLHIAQRVLQTEIEGLGYEHRDDREAGERAALGGQTLAEYAATLHSRNLEAIDALSYVDEHLSVDEVAIKTSSILQGTALDDFEFDDGADEDVQERVYPRPPLPGDVVENIVVPHLDWREVVAVSKDKLVLLLPGTDPDKPETWAWMPSDRFDVRVPRAQSTEVPDGR